MKETTSIIFLFLFIGLSSGAMSITSALIALAVGGLFIYIAWIEDNKEQLRKNELIIMRRERLARRGLNKF
ncbi:MAG: hypothetical protein MJK12_17145 [Colwellia sp.]|nr:hypothetical protein [Colwellia sp.]